MSKRQLILKHAQKGKHHIEVLTNLERTYNRILERMAEIEPYIHESEELNRNFVFLKSNSIRAERMMDEAKRHIAKNYIQITKLT